MRIDEKKQLKAKKLLWICLSLYLILMLFSACTSASTSVKIKGEISPEPVVGEIALLRVEAISEKYSGNGIITVQLPPEINLVEGELEWQGPVTAGEPFTHELSICVLRPGQWGIVLGAGATTLDGKAGDGDSTTLHITSTADSAQVIPSSDYRGELQAPFNSTPTPTPEPVAVSSECAGEGP